MTNATRMKTKWSDCEIIADKIGSTKHEVFNLIYSDIKDHIEDIKSGDIVAIQTAILLLKEKRANKIRIHDEVFEEMDSATQLKIAMWFINKIGDISRAKKLIDVAACALEKLR